MNTGRIQQWDERYRAGEQVFETPSPLVVQFTRDLARGAALDLASGPGRNALYLAERGWQVTAVDGSRVAIDLLCASAERRNIRIDTRVVDLEAAECDFRCEAYRLVLSCYFLQRNLIPAMKSALLPGGLLIMIVHLAGPDQPLGTATRAFPGELLASFEGWQILHYREGEPGEAGHRHGVAELVAQKPAEVPS